MTPAEAAILLAKISANDNREVTEAGARAWAEALPDVAVGDALEVLPSYYRDATRDSKNWIYPGDVLELVIAMHSKRRAALGCAARDVYVEAHSDDEDYNPLEPLRASHAAVEEYNRTHQIPGPAPRVEREQAEQRRRALGW